MTEKISLVKVEPKVDKKLTYVITFLIILLFLLFIIKFFDISSLGWIFLAIVFIGGVLLINRKPKGEDMYQILEKVQDSYFQKMPNGFLDISDGNVGFKELAPNRYVVNFEKENLSFGYINNTILGLENRSLYNLRNDFEKNEFMKDIAKTTQKDKVIEQEVEKKGFGIPFLGE